MEPRTYLRLEGLTVFAGALALYFTLAGPWWLLAAVASTPMSHGSLAGVDLGRSHRG